MIIYQRVSPGVSSTIVKEAELQRDVWNLSLNVNTSDLVAMCISLAVSEVVFYGH